MSMRTLPEIVEQVWTTLPEEVKPTFKSVRESALFAAPEIWQLHLNRFHEVFNDTVPNPPQEDWQIHAIAALMNVSIDELKKMTISAISLRIILNFKMKKRTRH